MENETAYVQNIILTNEAAASYFTNENRPYDNIKVPYVNEHQLCCILMVGYLLKHECPGKSC